VDRFSGVPALACLAVALLHLVRLALRRRDIATELAHAAMGLAMAGMFSPLGNPVPVPVWTVVFGGCAAWFTAAVLRSRNLAGDGPHHVVASGAMLFMLAAEHATPVAAGAGHGRGADTFGLVSVTAFLLTGYFVWYALRCADRCWRTAPADPSVAATGPRADVVLRAPSWSPTAPQVAERAHLVMAVAMAVMLIGMV
jgi:uncharacterized protein DUF5134